MSTQKEVIDLSLLVCSVDKTLGLIHSPRIMETFYVGRRSVFGGNSGVLRNISDLFSDRIHLPDVSHLDSSRYYLVFLKLICLPIACSAPEKRSGPDWASIIVSFVETMGEGEIRIIVES